MTRERKSALACLASGPQSREVLTPFSRARFRRRQPHQRQRTHVPRPRPATGASRPARAIPPGSYRLNHEAGTLPGGASSATGAIRLSTPPCRQPEGNAAAGAFAAIRASAGLRRETM